jgi:hypothetical protein
MDQGFIQKPLVRLGIITQVYAGRRSRVDVLDEAAVELLGDEGDYGRKGLAKADQDLVEGLVRGEFVPVIGTLGAPEPAA